MAQCCAIHALAAIYEREKGAQNPRLDFICHGKPASSHFDEHLAAFNNLLNEFYLPFVAGIPEHSFTANIRAFVLNEQREVEDTHVLLGKFNRHGRIASHFTARIGLGNNHMAHPLRAMAERGPVLRVRKWYVCPGGIVNNEIGDDDAEGHSTTP
jgi:hypothetical protein